MAESVNGPNRLLADLLEAIGNINLGDLDSIEEPSEESNKIIGRGLPCKEGSQKDKIHELLILNKRKKMLMERIDGIKNFMKQNDESSGLKTLGSYLNEILKDPQQRSAFLGEFEEHVNDQEPTTIPTANDLFLYHKGIHYIRILMTKYHSVNDNAILKELKVKNLLNTVFMERINNEKNYIMLLADTAPKSFEEIKFIVNEERDIILNSSIFVNMAHRSLQLLYEFLVCLLNIVNESDLSRSCLQSFDNGMTVSILLQQRHPPEIKSYAEKIEKFLNRNKRGF